MKLITFLYSYVTSLHRDTKGATAIEYAVIAGLLAAGLFVAFGALVGDSGFLAEFFNNLTITFEE